MVGEATFSATSGLASSHAAAPGWVLPVLIVLIVAAFVVILVGRHKEDEDEW